MEICHLFTYEEYTKKQRIIMWFLYMARNLTDIFSGILGIISLGLITTWWSVNISEKILRNQMKFHKENKHG